MKTTNNITEIKDENTKNVDGCKKNKFYVDIRHQDREKGIKWCNQRRLQNWRERDYYVHFEEVNSNDDIRGM
jgi:hypothetical protein